MVTTGCPGLQVYQSLYNIDSARVYPTSSHCPCSSLQAVGVSGENFEKKLSFNSQCFISLSKRNMVSEARRNTLFVPPATVKTCRINFSNSVPTDLYKLLAPESQPSQLLCYIHDHLLQLEYPTQNSSRSLGVDMLTVHVVL
jgi:hypothetical protein